MNGCFFVFFGSFDNPNPSVLFLFYIPFPLSSFMAILSREPVTALVAFKLGQAKPLQFLWGNRTYQVKTVDLTYSEWKGRTKIHYFSVHDGTNSFRLSYFSDTLQWFVETEELLL